MCGNKLINLNLTDQHLPFLHKTSSFITRNCPTGISHSYLHTTDQTTGKIDWIKLSFLPSQRWIEINYITNKSRIVCLKDGEPDYLDIGKALEPDFPAMEKLREKISLYVLLW
jgi:hypothetical protein